MQDSLKKQLSWQAMQVASHLAIFHFRPCRAGHAKMLVGDIPKPLFKRRINPAAARPMDAK